MTGLLQYLAKVALIGGILYVLLFVALSLITGTGISALMFIALFFYGALGVALFRLMV